MRSVPPRTTFRGSSVLKVLEVRLDMERFLDDAELLTVSTRATVFLCGVAHVVLSAGVASETPVSAP
jgi:hypothetical protein